MEELNVEKKLKVREDLNDIVTSIALRKMDTKYGVKTYCIAKLFNGITVQFNDKSGLYDYVETLKACGLDVEKEVVSRKLVDEIKLDDEGRPQSVYACVKYVMKDGTFFILCADKFIDSKRINLVYNQYQESKKQAKNTK